MLSFLPLPSCLMKSLNYFHFVNRCSLATSSWNSVVVRKYSILVDEHVLDANLRFLHIGVLGGVCSTCCSLLQLVRI